MLLKGTSVGDIEVQSDNEKEARAFVEGMAARGEIALEGNDEGGPTSILASGARVTHRIVVENGVRKLKRERFF